MLAEIPSPIKIMHELRAFYQSHGTEESTICKAVLKAYLESHAAAGNEATFLLAGSLSFSQLIQKSDIDLIYVGNNFHQFRTDKGDLTALMMSKGVVIRSIDAGGWDIDVVRKGMEKAIPGSTDYFFVGAFRTFVQRYWFHEPMTGCYEVLHRQARDIAARLGIMRPEDENLSNTSLDSSYLFRSFVKYHQRLASRGIDVPAHIIELEEALLYPRFVAMRRASQQSRAPS